MEQINFLKEKLRCLQPLLAQDGKLLWEIGYFYKNYIHF